MSGEFLFVKEDAISRGVLTSSSEHSEYPPSEAGNTHQDEPFRWEEPDTNCWLKVDLDLFKGEGGFEDWADDLPVDWIVDDQAGTVEQEQTIVDSGSSALKINGLKKVYRDFIVTPGKKYRLDFAMRGDGTYYAYCFIQDLSTLKFLNTSQVWVDSYTSTGERIVASYTDYTRTFTIEDSGLGYRRHSTVLRVSCERINSSGYGYFDSFSLIPEVNFSSVHAHNIPIGATLKHQYDDTGSFSGGETDAATFTIYPRSFHKTFTEVLARYHRLLLAEETGYTPYIGEWVSGHYHTLGVSYQWDWRHTREMPQSRIVTPTGKIVAFNRASDPSRSIGISVLATSELDKEQVVEDMFAGGGWGKIPITVVPDTNERHVFLSRVTNVFEHLTHEGEIWEYAVILTEDPFPVEFNF